jgi:hypothetical protein
VSTIFYFVNSYEKGISMKTIQWLVIGTLLASPFALAQESNPYSGAWEVNMVNNKGGSVNGEVVVKDQGGTWDINWQSQKKPCAGIKAPIVIQRASSDELVFEIKRSEALRGCKDHIATLKRVNDTTLQGELNDGRKLTLLRK